MDAPLAMTLGELGAGTGVVVAAGLAAAAILLRAPRPRAWAMVGALALTPILLVGHIWDTPQFEPFRDHAVLSAFAGVAGLAAVAGAAWLLRRWPGLFPPAVAAALPFRVPIESGGETAALLVPLYVVIAAGALAYAWPRLRASEDGEEADGTERRAERRPGLLEQALAAAVVLYALQASYSTNFDRALEQLVFFYLPFALLFVLLSQVPWSVKLAVRCLGVLVALGAVFAAVGFVEYATRQVILSSNAVDANSYQAYFRTSSLFFDPNVYGRFLVVVMVLVTAVVLWTRERAPILAGAALLLVLLAAVVLTLSQSSLAAFLVGLTVLAALRWGVARTALVTGSLLAAAAVAAVAVPGGSGVDLGSERDLDKSSSGRVNLIEGGVELWGDRPLWGYGAGSFEEEFRDQRKASRRRAAAASHTIPVTIAAEQGALGLAVYLVLLAAAFWRLLSGAWSLPRAAVAAAFAALTFHTLLYAAFLEDPLTWALLAVGVAWAWQWAPSPRERALARAEQRAARAARVAAAPGATATSAEATRA